MCVVIRVTGGTLGRIGRQRGADQRRPESSSFCEVKIYVPAWHVQGSRGNFPGYTEAMEVLNGRTHSQKTKRSHENEAETQSQGWDG